MYKYKCFGASLSTDFEIPFLPHSLGKKNSEIRINKGSDVSVAFDDKYFIEMNLKKGIFFRPKFGSTQISKGSDISYKTLNKTNPINLSFNLLSHPLGYAFYQKGEYVLHASAIEINNKAYLFTGASGLGKSTTVLNLLKNGRFITEDIARVTFKDNKAFIYPSLPVIKLKDQLIYKEEINIKESFSIDADSRGRRGFIIQDFDYTNEPVEISSCFVLTKSNNQNLREIFLRDSFKHLLLNSFCSFPRNTCKVSEEKQLKNIGKFLDTVSIFEYSRKMKDEKKENTFLQENFFNF